jgi:hydrogenase assembly chaperone HypC/HupF
MCLAIPMRVLRVEGDLAVCAGRNGVESVDTLLTGPLQDGQWVLVFRGSAHEIVDEERALQVSDALDALQAALQGAGPEQMSRIVAERFADLVGREPALPDFLKKAQGSSP